MSIEEQLEQVVARHWINICGYENVTRDDDFFELGGTSLQAAEVVAAIQSIVGDEVALMAAFFEEPTVAAMVRAIVEALNPDELSALVARVAT